MKKYLLILIAFFATILASSAQVGIGNVPNSNSILDLTNPTKWLILPKSPASPSLNPTFVSTEASLYYYNSKIYFSGFSGVNVLTPWKWDGEAAGVISSLPGNPVGIGFVPTVSNFLLSVAQQSGDVLAASGGNASIMVGNPSANHLLIDDNEIMAKTGPTNAGVLKLQEEGAGPQGTVEIRSAADAGETTVLTAYGSVDAKGKMKENGNDLLPRGAIIMWSGSAIPAGWALCDGGLYTPMDGSAPFNTPNLLDKFIVGAGGSYTVTSFGGAATHFHNVDPPLFMTDNTQGTHAHSGTTDGGTGRIEKTTTCCGLDWVATDVHTHTFTTAATQGAHSHTFDLPVITSSSSSSLPPYFALAYIMKL